jgi:hypothetical protein
MTFQGTIIPAGMDRPGASSRRVINDEARCVWIDLRSNVFQVRMLPWLLRQARVHYGLGTAATSRSGDSLLPAVKGLLDLGHTSVLTR